MTEIRIGAAITDPKEIAALEQNRTDLLVEALSRGLCGDTPNGLVCVQPDGHAGAHSDGMYEWPA